MIESIFPFYFLGNNLEGTTNELLLVIGDIHVVNITIKKLPHACALLAVSLCAFVLYC